MTFSDHKLNRVLGPLYVFTLELDTSLGEDYVPETNVVKTPNGDVSLVDYDFTLGTYEYRVLKVVYDAHEKAWLALCFEMAKPEEF